jgi:four helix bundle protein
MAVSSYRDLEVWQKAMDLVVECYKTTRDSPKDELYGLTSQLRRAAVSVPANVAEGHSRPNTREFLHLLGIAYASLAEVQTHIEIAHRLKYLSSQRTESLLAISNEVGRMLNGLASALRRRDRRDPGSDSAS